MMKRMRDSGLLTNPPSKEQRIDRLELILRGFGDGREAIKKILLGSEGMLVRPRIVRVTDATRLKFGGQRSKKPRRLG
jgi:small subunit ribosomal protein S11